MRKLKIYKVVRMVKEVYEVEAYNKKDAIKLAIYPSQVVIQNEKAFLVKL